MINNRKIPKISRSMYKPPKSRNAKNVPLDRPSEYKLCEGLVLAICPRIQVKQSKSGNFPTYISPSEYRPSPKKAFEKYKPSGLLSESYSDSGVISQLAIV